VRDVKAALTTSPVPLARTLTDRDVIAGDGYAKVILWAIDGETSAADPNVDYSQRYEILSLSNRRAYWQAD
jgi:hypothetical protein